ncbi:MAG: hypothetical protein N2235_23100 [Fischerella sp.]|nr:hypothetical protein [Fischerella sp.]
MQIEVTNVRNRDRKTLLERSALFFARQLKIADRYGILVIKSVPGLLKNERTAARMDMFAPFVYVIEIDSRITGENLLETVAHEMVHVKQRALGQARHEIRGGRVVRFWMGKKVDPKTHYYDLPWEVEAYTKQRILVNSLLKTVGMFNDV